MRLFDFFSPSQTKPLILDKTNILSQPYRFGKILTQSVRVYEILKSTQIIASTASTVLLQGESGTGKELMARSIHEQSRRSGKPFIAVHAASLSESLLESELFGHEKGSFTGAQTQRKGRFELAHEGTLFLDEISELSPSLQTKLLRVIQERCFERLGGNETISVDVRIIAATNKSLLQLVREKKFREDLYYRLNVITINLIPLRDRKEDIPLLLNELIQYHCSGLGKSGIRYTKEFLHKLESYDFPGNIRELSNIIERAIIFCKGEVMDASLIQFNQDSLAHFSSTSVKDLSGFEKKVDLDKIIDAYLKSNGNKARAARLVSMAESTYRYHLKKAFDVKKEREHV